MVSVALMAAIVILLANTPLGMIQLPPAFFHQQADVVQGMFFHTSEGAV